MARWITLCWIMLVAGLSAALADDADLGSSPALRPWAGEELAGGETTVFDRSHGAFGRALRNLDRGRWMAMRAGKRLFESPWQPPDPAVGSGPLRGLGPRFNAVSCAECHYRDGRGAPPAEMMAPPEPPPWIARLRTADGRPDPRYGGQLNDRGVGVAPEGSVAVEPMLTSWRSSSGRGIELQRPRATLSGLVHGPLDPTTRLDLRVPPTLVGLGLLEAVPDAALEALADPGDRDGDGISGRVRRLPSGAIGRFGWTAGQPDLDSQVAKAFAGDLGVTSSRHPHAGCRADDAACRRLAGEAIEITDSQLDRVVLYTRLLAPPARRDWDHPRVLAGREVFVQIGCANCHLPSLETAPAGSGNAGGPGTAGDREKLPEVTDQTIRPFTDLLLHDLGPGLASDAPEPGVEPGEWRTAPLWGLGLHERVNGHLALLHDGRARTIEEAILWHDGEAAAARDRFDSLSAADRDALTRFLESL